MKCQAANPDCKCSSVLVLRPGLCIQIRTVALDLPTFA